MSTARHLDSGTVERIARLDVRARLLVEGFLNGQHRSPYHGDSIEFASHREYVPGDELKHVDWRVWSRTDRMYVKQYEEETNLKCHILLDCSKSMRYGEASKPAWSKFDYGATAAASLAILLQHHQDAPGLVMFDRQIRKHLPPSTHPGQIRQLLHELEQFRPDDQSDISNLTSELAAPLGARGIVVLVSDLFLDLPTLKATLQNFRLRKHEVIVFHVLHKDELEFPFDENTRFQGLESDQSVQADPRSLRKAYLEVLHQYLKDVRRTCSGLGVDYVPMNTAEPLDAALASYLTARSRLRRQI